MNRHIEITDILTDTAMSLSPSPHLSCGKQPFQKRRQDSRLAGCSGDRCHKTGSVSQRDKLSHCYIFKDPMLNSTNWDLKNQYRKSLILSKIKR